LALLTSLQDFADLANLIILNLPTKILQIHEAFTVLKDDMASAALPLSKAKFKKQIAHVVETDIRVALPLIAFSRILSALLTQLYLAMQTFLGSVKNSAFAKATARQAARFLPVCLSSDTDIFCFCEEV
jgi:hypothetical protein